MGEFVGCHPADLIGQGALTFRRGVKVDRRGTLGVLPHPGHDFLEVRACLGSEHVAAMLQCLRRIRHYATADP
jgi:hypothetical protein